MAKIIDNFILIEPLGSGLYSETLKGRNLVSKSPVAVKTIKLDQFLNNQSLREMIINEIQVLKRLEHPNVLQMLKMLKSSNNIYLIYEFMSHGKLSSYLKQQGPLSESRAIEFFKQMIEAVRVVHKEDLIHNNLSPHTFYLHEENTIKLKNFLLARPANAKKSVEPEDLSYASPEILRNRAFGPKSDVFSLGLVFFEALRGVSLLSFLRDTTKSLEEASKTPLQREEILEIWRTNLENCQEIAGLEGFSKDLRTLLTKMLSFSEESRVSLEEVRESLGMMSKDARNIKESSSNFCAKLDKVMTKERNKVQFLLQNVQKLADSSSNSSFSLDFPRNLLTVSLLKTALFAMKSLSSLFCLEKTENFENFIVSSQTFDKNALFSWKTSEFGVFFIAKLEREAVQLREIIEKMLKEDAISQEIAGLSAQGLEFFLQETQCAEIIEEKNVVKWLFSFGNRVFEGLASRQKENRVICEEDGLKEQGILANYLLDVVFFKEFFENFIKNEGKLQEQKYFRHVESISIEKLMSMLEKKLAYARKQLQFA